MHQDAKSQERLPKGANETVQSEDLDFIADCKAAFLEERTPYANLLLLVVVGVVAAFVVWAYQSQVSELTRGQGKVIPSGSTQIVQSLEGGIVDEILTQEGQYVESGSELAKLNDTILQTFYRESLVERDNLVAKIARLDAESSGLQGIHFPETLIESCPELVASEQLLFDTRR